ncbi:MAG: lysophospholipid acyltransferase family protein [Deltaproteobacteria bacterium]|nr:lysophospholipid acyltransferase family protein [Deltaproteobacteria bacterium]
MSSKDSEKSRHKWYDPVLFWFLIPLFSIFVRLLYISCRIVRLEGAENERKAIEISGDRVIYASWHQRLFYQIHRLRRRRITVMISQSRDGEYIARLVNWLGLRDVRGSSTRGGVDALKDLVRSIRNGANGGMIPDGPTGPARETKIGTIILSRMTGAPIIPISWGADRCWVFNSWDRFMIPKPFARISYYYGEPIIVPRSAKTPEMEELRRLLDERLNDITRQCDDFFGMQRPYKK